MDGLLHKHCMSALGEFLVNAIFGSLLKIYSKRFQTLFLEYHLVSSVMSEVGLPPKREKFTLH